MIPLVLVVAVATATPTPLPRHSEDWLVGFHSGMTNAIEKKWDKIPAGAWVVTATVTGTPTPNPEATCVAVGHQWLRLKCYQASFMGDCDSMEFDRVFDAVKGDPWIDLCRRCHLWREKP